MSETPHGLFPARFERWFVESLKPVATFLCRSRVTPNALTIAGLFVGAISAALIALNHLRWALLPLVFMGLCDILDGEVAKFAGKTSRFGAILDSTFDRLTDFLVLCGIGVYFYFLSEPWWVFITALALAGTFQVSYVKARAEGEGLACNLGLAQRSERLILVALGLFLGDWMLKVAVVVLAALAYYTAAQRLLYLKKLLS